MKTASRRQNRISLFFKAFVLLTLLMCGCEIGSDLAEVGPNGAQDGSSDSDHDFEHTEPDAENDADLQDGSAPDGDTDADPDTDPDDDVIVEPRIPYEVSNGAIRNENGEVIYLRGINLSGMAKWSRDHLFALTEDDISLLLARGFNSVRLLTFWEAVMPEGPGIIDEIYIERFTEQVDMLTAAGIYVVIDMHQDLYGRPFGDGAPLWACPEILQKGYEPVPIWWQNYLSEQVMGCFTNFWDDPDLQDEMIQSWVNLAEATCIHDKVLGYDPMNEPWPGSYFGDFSFDNTILLDFYERAMTAIEEVCPGRIFFLGPSLAHNMGFTDVFDFPEEIRDRVVAAPHYYPVEVHEVGDGYGGDAVRLEERFASTFSDYLDIESPLWIGEFGGLITNPNFDAYLMDIHSIFLRNNIGSALWDYSLSDHGFSYLDSEGNVNEVYDVVSGLPIPTLLPSVPIELSPDFFENSLTVHFDCLTDRHVHVLLPELGPSTCQVSPVEAFSEDKAEPEHFSGHCLNDEPVTLTCPPL